MNSLVLAGVASSESQLKYSKDDKAICEFYLNFTSPSSPESWNQIKCVSFGKIAEASAQIREGENIICVGAINVTNKEYQGVKSRLIEFKVQHVETTPALVSVIVVNQMDLLSEKKQQGSEYDESDGIFNKAQNF